jgi:hypothetical protein
MGARQARRRLHSSRWEGKLMSNTSRELTFEEFCMLPMQYRFGMSSDNSAQRLYRNDAIGLQKEVHTPRDPRTMQWGDGEVSLFLDNDPREFSTVADVYVAWMHKVCGVPEADDVQEAA